MVYKGAYNGWVKGVAWRVDPFKRGERWWMFLRGSKGALPNRALNSKAIPRKASCFFRFQILEPIKTGLKNVVKFSDNSSL